MGSCLLISHLIAAKLNPTILFPARVFAKKVKVWLFFSPQLSTSVVQNGEKIAEGKFKGWRKALAETIMEKRMGKQKSNFCQFL